MKNVLRKVKRCFHFFIDAKGNVSGAASISRPVVDDETTYVRGGH